MVHLWEKVIITHDVRILWVRGHSKNWGNDMADKLAEEGADDVHDINSILENHGPWRPSDWVFMNREKKTSRAISARAKQMPKFSSLKRKRT